MKGAVITLWNGIRLSEDPGDPGSGATIQVLYTRADAIQHLLQNDPSGDTSWLPDEPAPPTPEDTASA